MHTDLSILARVAVALALAGILGWEREQAGKSAGVRTHMLVGMAAALFVMLGELVIWRFQHYSDLIRLDPIRVIEAVVTGVSFLGAGTIFLTRGKDHVAGLTTAASLWMTSAVGMAVALERYVLAIGSTLLLFVVLRLIALLSRGAVAPSDLDKQHRD